MLTANEKMMLEMTERSIIIANGPMDTRILIRDTVKQLKNRIPHLNNHHVAGMIAYLVKTNHHIIAKFPGYSIIE